MARSSIPKPTWRVFAPVHPDGHRFFALGLLATVVGFFLWTPLGWLLGVGSIAILLFFRDPQRYTPQGKGLIISPADGVVVSIENAMPPSELNLHREKMQCVSVFLSLLDCHVNRAPVDGIARRIVYQPGQFFSADKEEASSDNERRSMLLETGNGEPVICVQIAGKLARRIVTHVTEGDHLLAGERIGLIRFGSRVDVYFNSELRVLVGIGQRVIGGETVLADTLKQDIGYSFAPR